MKKIVVSSRKAVSSGKVTSFAFMNSTEHEVLPTTQECISKVRPITDALYVLNGKWKLPLIFTLRENAQRFNEILKSVEGVTPKVLAKELKDLEQHQLIKRTIIDDYPVRISYTLETYADTLTPIIYSLKDWGINHRKKIVGNYC